MRSIEKRVKKEFSGRASPEKAIAFADVISYFQRALRTMPKWFKEEKRRVNRYIRKAAKGEFSRAQARVFVEYALQNRDEDLAWSCINKALEQNPDDPYFLFVRFQLEVGSFYGFVDEEELEELKRILSLAEKQRDHELTSKIRKTIQEIEKMGFVREIFDDDDEELDEEEEELDEAVAEVNQHEPDTALALAKAYIELGEEDIARDFLLDVINAGSADLKSEAEEMLASLG